MISEIFDADNDGIYEAQVYGMSPYVTFGPEADMYTMLVHLFGITSGETYSYVPADPSEPAKQGLVQDEDGEIRYYVDGEPTYAGVVQDAEGNLYYINSTLKAVRNCKYGIGTARTNGLIEAGIYQFDEEGKLIR